MGVKIVSQPAIEPLTLAETKEHLRVDTSTDDAKIARLISAAREQCEQEIDRSIAQQVLMLQLDAFPLGAIFLPRGPVLSVDLIQYVDVHGVLQTVANVNYTADNAQIDAWVLPAFDYAWPQARSQANSVRVTYTAGYTACPEALREWMLLAVGTMFENCEADSDRPAVPHNFVARLLDRYRVHPL